MGLKEKTQIGKVNIGRDGRGAKPSIEGVIA
jgi:hypothetical protein